MANTYWIHYSQHFEDRTPFKAETPEEAEKIFRQEFEINCGADVEIFSIKEANELIAGRKKLERDFEI